VHRTAVSGQAILRLGLQGIINDRDVKALALGEARAHRYMDHLFKENQFQYPPLGTPYKVVHDGTNLYSWIFTLGLGFSDKQLKAASETSRVLTLPPNNIPYNLPTKMTDLEFAQVRCCF
jgi:hypothetical protein